MIATAGLDVEIREIDQGVVDSGSSPVVRMEGRRLHRSGGCNHLQVSIGADYDKLRSILMSVSYTHLLFCLRDLVDQFDT